MVAHFAFHYHWTEDEVLGLPLDRCSRYLECLNRQVKESSG